MQLKGRQFLLQGPRFPIRGQQFPSRALSSPYTGPFNCLIVGHSPDFNCIRSAGCLLAGPKPRECQGGGKKRGGGKKSGGAKPHEETPTENGFRPPLPSVRLPPPPPYSISLSKSLRNSQNFPQLISEKPFGGSQKAVSDAPSSRGFAFRYVLPPPPLDQSRFWGRGCDEALFSENKGLSVKRGEAIQ